MQIEYQNSGRGNAYIRNITAENLTTHRKLGTISYDSIVCASGMKLKDVFRFKNEAVLHISLTFDYLNDLGKERTTIVELEKYSNQGVWDAKNKFLKENKAK